MSALNDFIREVKSYSSILTKQQLKTFIGQARSGEVEAARKGLKKVLKRLKGESSGNGVF